MAASLTADLAGAFETTQAPRRFKDILWTSLAAAFAAVSLGSASYAPSAPAPVQTASVTDTQDPPPVAPDLPEEPSYPAMETASAMQDCNQPAQEVAVSRPAFAAIIGVDYGHAALTGGVPDMGASREVSVINRAGRALEPAFAEAGLQFVTTRANADGARFAWPHGYRENVAARGNVLYGQGADMLISLHADVRSARDSGMHIFVHSDVPGGRADPASLDLARHVAAQFRRDLGIDVEIRTDNFSVLRNFKNACKENDSGTCPGMLIEIGNLRNTSDYARMSSDAQMSLFARSLASAIQTYPGATFFSFDGERRSARLNLSCHMVG